MQSDHLFSISRIGATTGTWHAICLTGVHPELDERAHGYIVSLLTYESSAALIAYTPR